MLHSWPSPRPLGGSLFTGRRVYYGGTAACSFALGAPSSTPVTEKPRLVPHTRSGHGGAKMQDSARNCSPTTDSLSSPSHRPDQSYNPKPPVSDPSWTVETAAAPSFAYLADRDVFILGRRPTNKLESDVSLAAHPSQSLLMFELSGASSWPPGRQNKRWSRCRDSLRNLAIRSKGPSSSDLGAAIHLSTTRNRRWNSFSSAAGCQRSSIRIL